MKKMEMNFNWKCIIPTVEIKHDTQRIATMRGGQKESGICHVFPRRLDALSTESTGIEPMKEREHCTPCTLNSLHNVSLEM